MDAACRQGKQGVQNNYKRWGICEQPKEGDMKYISPDFYIKVYPTQFS